MDLQCQEIVEKYVASLSTGFYCREAGDRLRIITPYPYPNNSLVEVFIEELPGDSVRVTDLGETLRYLDSVGFDVFISPKRRFLIETIASRSGVEIFRGQLRKTGTIGQIGELMLDLIITARGVSDLIYTSKTYEPATFLEEVDRSLKEHNIPFESSGVKLRGTSGKIYPVHFRILVQPQKYIQTLSPPTAAGLTPRVNATFRMWSDCNGDLGNDRKIAVLNNVDFEWREHDIILLGRVSTVVYWSRPNDLWSALGVS